jgi:hypothetical protein
MKNNRMILRISLALLLTSFLCTCAPSPKEEAAATTPPPVAAVADGPSYPSISLDRLQYLWNNATYMDATFYNLPISINQSTLEQIRSTINSIGEAPAQLKADCKPAGHIWFQVNGKNVEEADIYFQPGCTSYVWFEDGKPAYGNEMTLDGVKFYNNIIQSVQQQVQ